MYERIITSRTTPIATPEQLAAFGRFDVPQSSPVSQDYELLELFIAAASDQVEALAATAGLNEQVVLTFDYFPGQQDPRNFLDYQISYAYNAVPWWWYGYPTRDSIELVRRPVILPSGSPVTNAITVTYNDTNQVLQTLDPSIYTVQYDKICLNVNCAWPETDRRQDCIQITYWAGYSASDPTQVPSQLRLAILYLANHFWNIRDIVSVEPTSEIGQTLCALLKPFRSYRLPR